MSLLLLPEDIADRLADHTHFTATSGAGLDSIARLVLQNYDLPPIQSKRTGAAILLIAIANLWSIGESDAERARAEPFLEWGQKAMRSGFVIDPSDTRHTSTRCVFHKPHSRTAAFICIDHPEMPFIIGWSEQRGYTFIFNFEPYPLVNPTHL